jgi:molecular chaperone GrpE (heat shock protein)
LIILLDVKKELHRYEEITLDNLVDIQQSELSATLNIFTKAFQRLGKEQFKATTEIENITEMLEEMSQNNKDNRELKNHVKSKDSEIERLVSGIISICDTFEDMYIFSEKSQDEEWKKQINLQWSNLNNIISLLGLTRIGKIGGIFKSEFHRAIEVKNQQEIPNGKIVEIIKSGYMYCGKLLRKADVIINYCEGDE